ncbi:outer membrane beta-barrel protein [Algivirga pacifica]|uniref:Porin family protein n=1 Tax=Algivirga pacifica TaxID=1162670 RepID=A0ABP9D1F3_9BACT
MKKLVLLLTLLTAVGFAQAQVKFGIKGGASAYKLAFDDIDNTFSSLTEGGRNTGWHAGFQLQFKMPVIGIYVQPEAYYNSVKGELDFNGNISEVDTKRIDVPVMFGWRLGLFDLIAIRPHIGPVLRIKLEDGYDEFEDLIGGEVDTNGGTLGYQAGLGLDLLKFTFDARYEGALSKEAESITGALGNTNDFDPRSNQWIFSLGYWF